MCKVQAGRLASLLPTCKLCLCIYYTTVLCIITVDRCICMWFPKSKLDSNTIQRRCLLFFSSLPFCFLDAKMRVHSKEVDCFVCLSHFYLGILLDCRCHCRPVHCPPLSCSSWLFYITISILLSKYHIPMCFTFIYPSLINSIPASLASCIKFVAYVPLLGDNLNC